MTLLATACLALVASGWVLWRVRSAVGVSPYLLVALWFVLILWYGVPTFFIAPFVEEQRRLYGSLGRDYLELLTIGNLSLLAAVAILLLRRPFLSRVVGQKGHPTSQAVAEWSVLLAVGLGVAIHIGTTNLFGETYLERNAFQVVQQNTNAYDAAGTVAFASELVFGVLLAYLTVNWSSRGQRGWVASVAAWGWILYSSISLSLNGARIALLMPLVLVAFAVVRARWTFRRMIRWAAIGTVTLVAGGTASIAISRVRAEGSFNISGVLESSTRSMTPESMVFWGALLGEVTEKFNNVLGGTLLLAKEGPGAAGLQPFAGAVLSFAPRFLLPSKPVPGSADGTYAGHPSRIAAVLLDHDETAGNVQVSPAAVTVWELGYGGLPILVLANAAFLVFINSLLLSALMYRRVLGFILLGAPAFIAVVPSIDVCIQEVIRVGVVALAIGSALQLARAVTGGNAVGNTLGPTEFGRHPKRKS